MARRLARPLAAALLAVGLLTAATVAPAAARAGSDPLSALPLAAATTTGHSPATAGAGHGAPRRGRGSSPATIALGVVVAAGFIAATIMMLRRQYAHTPRRRDPRGTRRRY